VLNSRGGVLANPSKKILIVDPDPEAAGTLQETFSQDGFEVEAVVSSAQALVTLEYFQPDLVVADVILEEPDAGFHLARQIKEHPLLGGTPVFLLSSTGEKTGTTFSFAEDGYWMKADDYAEKPLPPGEVLKRVYTLLAKS
jgi:CheY-like chemotaxis protein